MALIKSTFHRNQQLTNPLNKLIVLCNDDFLAPIGFSYQTLKYGKFLITHSVSIFLKKNLEPM